jgi:hypothetical protein
MNEPGTPRQGAESALGTPQPVPGTIREVADRAAFAQLLLEGEQPAVLREAVSHWALCAAARQGDAAVLQYLQTRDTGQPVYTIIGQPQIAGRFGYRRDLQGLNHQARQVSLSSVLPHLSAGGEPGTAHAIAVQAAPLRQVIREWDQDNPMPLLPPQVAPTLWVSNRAQVAPHSDIHDNIACVAAGSRQFVLFPPEQGHNLYLGPLLDAPGGVPVSTADPWQPDTEQHPRFAEALKTATATTLYPGDALFIPALWWHAVQAREAVNVLVNYWWGGNGALGLSPYEAMSHAILAISKLPANKRRRWQQYFEHLVFRNEHEPGAHLPPDLNDLLSTVSEPQAEALAQRLAQTLLQGRR